MSVRPDPSGPSFWKEEIDRAQRVAEKFYPKWQEHLDYYAGASKDATDAASSNSEWVNVNVDFYETEQKRHQLFYETPDLQMKAEWPGGASTGQAHRALLNELLGPDYAHVLRAIHKAINDCLVPSGFGATKICYQPTVVDVPAPEQPGNVLNLQQGVQVPIHEQWKWDRFSPKKLLIPADFHDSDYDAAPWLGMRFRMPLSVAKREFNLPATFEGTNTRDEKVLNEGGEANEPSGLNYVDGVEIWYYAAVCDEDVIHPLVMRRHILIEGIDAFCEKDRNSPYQSLDAQGRLTADSMIGSPIHPLTLRDLPDSAYPPSDAAMRRSLVREKCKFRTQQMQERDANRSKILIDAEAFTPDVIAKIENGSVGSMILVEPGKLAAGVGAIMAEVVKATSHRQTYEAEAAITEDIQKTSGIDSTGAGVTDDQNESATKTAEVARARNVRIDGERRRVLQWYLSGVAKFSALVCRYMTPDLVTKFIGPEAAQVWNAWPKQQVDFRMAFTAKPDSQIRLDTAAERRSLLQLYQMTVNDPHSVRVELLKRLYELNGLDPQKTVSDQLPEQKPDPSVSLAVKGEDLYNPMMRELLAQCGLVISQPTIDEAASQLFKQVAIGVRDASGKAIAPTSKPQGHGGPAEQARPLSKQQGDLTGNRPGATGETAQ